MRRFRERNGPLTKNSFLTMTSVAALIVASVNTMVAPARADDAVNQKWIDSEFQPPTLSKSDQMKELQWFSKAAAPFKGMDINIVPETITTRRILKSKTLAKAVRNHRYQDQARYHPGR